jgi:hypothetical protein
MLEIVPRLHEGVYVHIHDICFPLNYPKNWVIDDRKYWLEQYLVQAFICKNKEISIEWCFSHMKYYRKDIINRCFPFYDGDDMAGSLWFSIVGASNPAKK